MSYARVTNKTQGAAESKQAFASKSSSALRTDGAGDRSVSEADNKSTGSVKPKWSLAKVSLSARRPTSQAGASGRTRSQDGEAPPAVYQALQQPGKPLDHKGRRHFENRFGHDLGEVRIHTGEMANEAASSIHAAAYTVGSDIVFANSRYSPDTLKGRLLLQHELRHVEQQRFAKSVERPALDASGSLHENQARSILAPKVAPLAEQRVQRAPENADASFGSSAVDAVGSSIFGASTWPFLKAVFEGFAGGLKSDVQGGRAEKAKEHLKQIFFPPWNAAKFYGGYIVGFFLGLVSPITDLIKGLIGLVKLAASALVWQAKWSPVGVAISPERQNKILRLQDKFGELAVELGKSLAEFAKSPKETAKKISAFLDNLMQLALGKARELGAKAAHSIFDLLDKDFYDMGESIGEVIGALVAQILLLVFSEAIGNLITKGASMLGKLAEVVAGKAVEIFRWVKGLFAEIGALLRSAVKGALKLFEGLANKAIEAFDGLVSLFVDSEALDVGGEKVAAGVGRVSGPGVPNVMESRMVTSTRTAPAKVSDLTPPKIHPSNVPEEMPVTKEMPKRPKLGEAPFDEPLTKSERGLTPEQLRQKHILEDIEGSQSQVSDVAQEEFGKGPGKKTTGKGGAGLKAKPKHHVLPQELEDKEQFFSKRGFTGDHHIDEYTVELEESAHQAAHGGGNYKLGRTTGFDWNTRVASELKGAESKLGRMLTRDEIIKIVERLMKEYKIPRRYVSYK